MVMVKFLSTVGRSNAVEIAKELIRRGADWSIKAPDSGLTCFDAAFEEDNEDIITFLLQHYQENLLQLYGRHCLHAVLQEADYLLCEEDEESDSDSDSEDEDSSIEHEKRTITKVVLKVGTLTMEQFLGVLAGLVSSEPESIRTGDDERAMPVHISCRSNAPIDVTRFLIDQDEVVLQISDDTGSLPLHAACESEGVSLGNIELLLERGGIGTLCARNRNGALPLHVLCEAKPSVDKVKFVVRSYLKAASIRLDDGSLPVMLAVTSSSSEEVIYELLKNYPEALAYMQSYYQN